MSNMKLIQCPDCGSYNGEKDPECAQCGKRFNNFQPHKQDAKHDPNRRRQKKRFDDEDDDEGMDY